MGPRKFTTLSTDLKGELPKASFDDTINTETVAGQCVAYLSDLSLDHVLADSLWKDNVCLTGSSRTFHTSKAIVTAWKELEHERNPTDFQPNLSTAHVFRLGPKPAWVTVGFTFRTTALPKCQCSGSLNAVPDSDGKWKIFSLTTILESIEGYTNPDTPPEAPANKATDGVLDCLVVGAGAAGLGLGGRLQSLGLRYLVVDKQDEIGDNWAKRYDSAKLHLSNSYSDLPYERFLDYSKYYPTKNDLVRAYRSFAKRWDMNTRMSTAVEAATWDAANKTWIVTVKTAGRIEDLKARHLVMATGGGNDKAYIPELADRDRYKGIVTHMVNWKNAEIFQGKRGIIVGCGNSAFDMMEDMINAGLSSVTMIQRATTRVCATEHFMALTDPMYNQHSDLGVADRMFMTGPYQHGRLMIIEMVKHFIAQEPGRYDKLRAAGFLADQDPDIMAGPMERFGGHYLDIGQTKFIEDGRVKVKSGSAPAAYTEKGLILENGNEVEADVIAFATGFTCSMKQSTTEIVGKEIGDQLEDFWGFDPEGEVLGLAKPLRHPHIWYFGGGTAQARFTSRFLAMQILAEVEGIPFKPYTRRFD
ncbi:hypothetical protein B9Z65_7 [Elsinoe australis]|uniref:FAD/NAD(P)-binding domain-containing protein n=1 Tax=Elsinoe australis TaxID=40998 RepID=A0A2P7YWM7_9PEZI|nr:hypothetical protein B9Z65_7 [Elsinoe australis]